MEFSHGGGGGVFIGMVEQGFCAIGSADLAG